MKQKDKIIFERYIPRSIYLPEDKEKIMKKVYCKECKYIAYKLSFLYFFMREGFICKHSSNIKRINDEGNFYKVYTPEYGFIDRPIILNQNNDCKNFKYKWYFYIINRVKEIMK